MQRLRDAVVGAAMARHRIKETHADHAWALMYATMRLDEACARLDAEIAEQERWEIEAVRKIREEHRE